MPSLSLCLHFGHVLVEPNPYNEGKCEIMKYMCNNITSISSCLTSGGVQEKEKSQALAGTTFFIKIKTFMCLPFHH